MQRDSLSIMQYIVCTLHIWQGRGIAFRNIPEWNFAFAARHASRSTGLQKQEAGWCERAARSQYLEDPIGGGSPARLHISIDRSILYRRDSRRQTLIIARYFYLSAAKPSRH